MTPTERVQALDLPNLIRYRPEMLRGEIEKAIREATADFLCVLNQVHEQLECPARNTTVTSHRRDGSVIISQDVRKAIRDAIKSAS